jgi:hypothetical protein
MFFPKPLRASEQCFFATRVVHGRESAEEHPIVEVQVTSHGIAAAGLTMRIQFDPGFYPQAAWWFGDIIDARRLLRPALGDPRRLEVSTFGYLEHTFTGLCRPKAKYGIGWEWE